jgi:MHS family proline/betaine transporter-like MFS transporter
LDERVDDPMKPTQRMLWTCSIGQVLECCDFTLYAIFISTLTPLFFPSDDPWSSLMSGWLLFALGHTARPLGGAIFGWAGDRWGRKVSLTASLVLMSVSTFLMSILPVYNTVGLWAPCLLVFCRILQGLSVGGEFNGSMVYVLEQTMKIPPSLRASIIFSTGYAGAVLASLMGMIFYGLGMSGWRWAFLTGSLIGTLALYMRLSLPETPIFQNTQENKDDFQSLKWVDIQQPQFWTIVLIVGYTASLANYALWWGNTNTLKNTSSVWFYVMVIQIGSIVFGLFSGYIASKVGVLTLFRNILKLSVLMLPLAFFLLSTNNFLLNFLGLMLLAAMWGAMAPYGSLYIHFFFPFHRCRLSGLSHGLGTAFIGGVAPLIFTYTHTLWANPCSAGSYIAFILIVLNILFFLSVFKQKVVPSSSYSIPEASL